MAIRQSLPAILLNDMISEYLDALPARRAEALQALGLLRRLA